MKQILLRVPDDLHRRLAERAQRDGRSVNALAGELLDLGVGADESGRRGRLRMRAAGTGLAAPTPPAAEEDLDRASIVSATHGWTAKAGELIDAERDHR